jgi:hypothetical protein
MDLMDVDTSEVKPWHIIEGTIEYTGRGYSRGVFCETEVVCTTEVLKESKRLKYRVGDIIKFRSSYHMPRKNPDWKDWFLTKTDKKKMKVKNPADPIYCSSQYAVIVNKYKKIKKKNKCCTYQDYGVLAMMLTGPNIGRVRNMYMKCPFTVVCKFQDIPNLKKLKKPFKNINGNLFYSDILNLTMLNKQILETFGVTDESRKYFIDKIHKATQEVINVKSR